MVSNPPPQTFLALHLFHEKTHTTNYHELLSITTSTTLIFNQPPTLLFPILPHLQSNPLTTMPIAQAPTMLARYTTASILTFFLSIWAYHAFPDRNDTPSLTAPMHSYMVPLTLSIFYLASLPSLKYITDKYLATKYDMKLLLTESMIIYNVAQVFLNGWMVYAIIDALLNKGHPFVGTRSLVGVAVESGSSYAVWVHYCDKYLEFFDTYFMVLRGKMDQVSC